MKGFDFLKIKSAVQSRNKIDLSFSHLTTMQIGEILPLGVVDCIPGDEHKVDYRIFSRLAPLVKPTYGRLSLKTVSAFVPYHMIASDAEAWLAGKTSWEGYTPHHRYFRVIAFFALFTTTANGLMTTVGATQQNCDISYLDSGGQTIYMVFTKKGKYYMKILNALGYSLPSGVDRQSGSSWGTYEGNRNLSAYPLLCFMKLYNDYLSQSQRFNTSLLSNILNAIKYNKAYAGIWNEATGEITSAGILAMLNAVFLNYENDYFTSAWQSANSPLANVENVSSIKVPVSGETIIDDYDKTYAGLFNTQTGTTILPQRLLDYLKAFDKWIRRNNFSGSRAVQQLFSRFGIKVSDYTEHYADVIKVDSFPIEIGDVTAMADNNGVPLGDYAGKAIVSGGSSFNYRCDDYGIMFILGFVTVAPMNPYGSFRRVLMTEPLEYYQPELDGLGADAISVGEYYTSPIDETRSVLDSSVYGFTERYNHYRFGRDVITGEFRNYHPDGDMNVWHLGRNLDSVRNAGYLLAQNTAVNTLPQTDSEYNRIFSNTSGNVDHFYMTCQFNIKSMRNIKNLNQVVDLGEGDTVVPRNGNTIS